MQGRFTPITDPVTAPVTNTGDADGARTVEFRVDDTTVTSESTTVEFTGIDTAALGVGEHAYGVYADTDKRTGTITVSDFAPSNYDSDGDGSVAGDLNGVLQAIADFTSGKLTTQQVLQVIAAYNS